MTSILKIVSLVTFLHQATCSIDGISYINDQGKQQEQNRMKGENPCNPLYWYPRSRPSYCDEKLDETTQHPNMIPLPIPIPAPAPPPAPQVPIGIPIAPTNPFIPVAGMPIPMPPMMPPGYLPPPAFPVPYPMPYPPMPMPYPYGYYPPPRPMMGMVPGIPGLVSNDGAINILPFSDVYSDVLEKHRQKVIRKRLENALEDYEGGRREARRSMSQQRRHKNTRAHVPRSERDLSE